MEPDIFIPSTLGRKIDSLRRLRGISQETLAAELNISRKTLVKLLSSNKVDDEKLEQIATALGSTIEAIKNFSEEAVFSYVQNYYDGSSSNYSGLYHCSINPLEKLLEMVEENKNLYQKLIETEREKNEILQRLLDKK